MATNGISTANVNAPGVAGAYTSTETRHVTTGSSQGTTRGKSARNHSVHRQVMNIEGNNFDHTAPRGTYLNIVV